LGNYIEEDPNEPTYLSSLVQHDMLTVYGAYLIAAEEWDLFRIVPIPGYSGTKMYTPTLDYTYVMIDQSQRSFTEITLTQISSCVTGMCIPYGVQKEVRDDQCNLAPLIGLERGSHCQHEVQTAQPFFYDTDDGVIYSVGEPLAVRIECPGGQPGPDDSVTLQGSGIIDVPEGCQVSANNWKVLGRPATLQVTSRHALLTPSTEEGKGFTFTLPFTLPTMTVTHHLFKTVTSFIGDTLWIVLGVVCGVVAVVAALIITGYVKAAEAREYVLAIKRKLAFAYSQLPVKRSSSSQPPSRGGSTTDLRLHTYQASEASLHDSSTWLPTAPTAPPTSPRPPTILPRPPTTSPKPMVKKLGSPSVRWKDTTNEQERSDDYIDFAAPTFTRPRTTSAGSRLNE
jgi:hypothetical protein